MSRIRAMSQHPDRALRRDAYRAEIEAWEHHAAPIAAALNGIKGEETILARRRGWMSALDQSLFENHIDRASLDAMMDAATSYFPHFHRYLAAKARSLGVERLAWYDLSAPVADGDRSWTYSEASEVVLEGFAQYSSRLHDLAFRAFRERWIDASSRPNKQDGAFCVGLRRDESRILINFRPTATTITALAHELGHAYHSAVLSELRPLQRQYPKTLAETASIFCETLVRQHVLDHTSNTDELVMLDSTLQSHVQQVVDIASRFLFEQELFERRSRQDVPVSQLVEMMTDAQAKTYGEVLDPAARHPYMWAAKPHYYGPAFYNYPYMFGLLFGLGLYSRYEQDPGSFRRDYDSLLLATGSEEAAELASRFGIDIRSSEFWTGSLDTIRREVDRFEAAVDRSLARSAAPVAGTAGGRRRKKEQAQG